MSKEYGMHRLVPPEYWVRYCYSFEPISGYECGVCHGYLCSFDDGVLLEGKVRKCPKCGTHVDWSKERYV